jgi:5-methylcytosine-specific restriction protein A
MPTAAPKPCKKPGCRLLTTQGAYCPEHAKVVRQQTEVKRESSTKRGYGYRWQQTSKGFLKAHPLCQCPDCLEGEIRLLQSTVVDHIIPHRVDEAIKSGDEDRIAKAWALFWNRDNWQAMSKPCHDKKTATEDGGFRGKGGGR